LPIETAASRVPPTLTEAGFGNSEYPIKLCYDYRLANDAVGMGSAPASGAVGRALAAHTGRGKYAHYLVRPSASVFGARARRTAAGAAALPENSTASLA